MEKKLESRGEKPEKGKGKAEDREEKRADKVRWVVITQWEGDGKDDTSDRDSLIVGQPR
jgi:hypothetical protein